MRVIHTVTSITQEASGPSYTVARLCQSLIDIGHDVTLATLDWAPVAAVPAFVKRFPIGVGPKSLGRSPTMYKWLTQEASASAVQVIHNHGMWQMNTVYPGWAVKRRTAKLVASPHGSLSTWAMNHGSRSKALFWPLLQRPTLDRAACFHASSEAEYEDIRRLGFLQPTAIIHSGIDVPDLKAKAPTCQRKLLFLGRIHPVKGIDILLHAWHAVADCFADWELLIVGPDSGNRGNDGYLEEMKSLAITLGLNRVQFAGPLYGPAKLSAYQEADLFVLPSHSENFGVAVAEALAAGTPAIVSKGAPWQGLEVHGCGWWVNFGVAPLISALTAAMGESREQLAQRGVRGREWMVRDFSWRNVAGRMNQIYRWLIDGGDVPSWIRLN